MFLCAKSGMVKGTKCFVNTYKSYEYTYSTCSCYSPLQKTYNLPRSIEIKHHCPIKETLNQNVTSCYLANTDIVQFVKVLKN